MKTRKTRSTRLSVEALEQRDTPSVTSVLQNNYLLTINCNSSPSNVSVETVDIEYASGNAGSMDRYQVRVKDTTIGFDKSYWINKSSSSRINFNGGSANDIFKTTTNIACTIKGNGGNDTLTGGPLGDIIYGGYGNDVVNGGAGNDLLYGEAGTDTLSGGIGTDKLYGGTENDKLYGNAGTDYLYGSTGNDLLSGGEHNDNLYGGAGTDSLNGDEGSDFLDDGSGLKSSTETNTTDGNDFLAYRPVNGVTEGKDVFQGAQNTCWILSPLISAANAGMNLSSRITYQGNGNYVVKLFKPGTTIPLYVPVNLEGGHFSFEPGSKTDESWIILFQRAILKQFTSNISDPNTYPWFATAPSQSMPYITGRSASFELAGGTYIGSFGLSDIERINNALKAGKLVCAGSRQVDYGGILPGVVSVSNSYVCGSHFYSVQSVDMNNKTIMLRNPWGRDVSKDLDGNILHNMEIQGENDGNIVLKFNEFLGSFAMMSIG